MLCRVLVFFALFIYTGAKNTLKRPIRCSSILAKSEEHSEALSSPNLWLFQGPAVFGRRQDEVVNSAER